MPTRKHCQGAAIILALLCEGCGDTNPPLVDLDVQRPPPQLYAKYGEFYLISQDKGATYDYLYVSRRACTSGLFSVVFPELGDVNFRDFDDELKDIISISTWPLPRKPSWTDHVNAPQTEAELSALRRSVQRGSPFGDESWLLETVDRLGIESTLRPQGRPKKKNGA